MSDHEKIHVQIGQVKIGRAGQSLHAILGSCIGLGFFYPEKGLFGLAHSLLAQSDKSTTEQGGRSVEQAIKTLFSLMGISGRESRKLTVLLAGGANMTMPADTDPSRLVGTINASYALKTIRELGLRTIHEDLGGAHGRQVTIDCTSGDFQVAVIPRLGK